MSTYTDLHNKTKETINVDYHTRVTPQKVLLLNPENVYWGTFKGAMELSGNNIIDGGTVEHVTLKDSILDNVSFKDGLKLDDIQQDIINLSSAIDNAAEKQANINQTLSTTFNEENQRLNTKIEFESTQRNTADQQLSTNLTQQIVTVDDQAKLRDEALNLLLDDEISNRLDAEKVLLSVATDEILNKRHLKFNNIQTINYPIQIHDFTVNTLIDNIPEAYVYKNSGINTQPVGKVILAKYNTEGVLTGFTFKAFADHPDTYELTSQGMFTYEFNQYVQSIYTGVGGYRLTWTNPGITSTNVALYLDSNRQNGYYNVNYDGTTMLAGTIDINCERDQLGNLTKCKLTISDTPVLSNFITTSPLSFTANHQTLSFTGRDGSICEASLNDNIFELYSGRTLKKYLDVIDTATQTSFATIYENGIVFNSDKTDLEALEVIFIPDNKTYVLTKENNFTTRLSGAFSHLVMSFNTTDNVIKIINEKKWYTYQLNGNIGTLTPDKYLAPNKKLDNEYEQVAITLTLPISQYQDILNKEYILVKSQYANTYICEQEIQNFGSIKLTYVKNFENNVTILINSNGATDQLKTSVNLTVSPTITDASSVEYISNSICNDIFDIQDSEWSIIEEMTEKYTLVADLSQAHSGGESTIMYFNGTPANVNTFNFVLPNKHADIPGDSSSVAARFILNTMISSPEEIKFANLRFSSNKDFKLFFMNKELGNEFAVVTNKHVSLQFEEIFPGGYLINDLNDSLLDYRTTTLSTTLDAMSVDIQNQLNKHTTDIDYISSEISTTVLRNRDDISLLGDVYLSTQYNLDAAHEPHNHISALIATNTIVNGNPEFRMHYGFAFRCVSPTGAENTEFELFDENSETTQYITNNTYIVFKTPNSTSVPLNTLKYSDFAFVKDFSVDILKTNSRIDALRDVVELSVENLQTKIDTNKTHIDAISSTISNDISGYIDNISNSINTICTELSTEISNTQVSVDNLSTYTYDLTLSVENLSIETNQEISNIKSYISGDTGLNDRLSTLETHYGKTFSEIEYIEGTDTKVDILNITDGNNTSNQYTLQFLSGTLVLVKNS